MRVILAALCGFGLDLLLGDPAALTPLHPVAIMGRAVVAMETRLRARFPKTPAGERAAGRRLAAALPLGTMVLTGGSLWALYRLWAPLGFLVEVVWCWQAVAVKNLRDEAMNVYRALQTGTIEDARRAVGRIVGRDTEVLDATGVTRAAVETVGENFADGIVSPLFYMLAGGAPLALGYKAVNTMDSMVGYKNERYLHFGRAAARLDDACNYIPARLGALLLIGAAFLTGRDGKGARRVWRRDRRNHESPNSAQCEAAMAGALGVRLGGPASYFGKMKEKPPIGDDARPVEPEDIPRACGLEYAGSGLALGLLCGLRALILLAI